MNNQITIKYKEETLLKSEMTEREKAIWDDGYKDGYNDLKNHRDNRPLAIAVLFVIVFFVTEYFRS